MAKNTKVSLFSQKEHKRFFDMLISNSDFGDFYEKEILEASSQNHFNFKDFQVSLLHEYEGTEIRLPETKVGIGSIEYYKTFSNRTDISLNNVLIFDFETTDFKGWAVSLALVAYDIQKDKVVNQFYELINPKCVIPQAAIDVHHITNEMVADKPHFSYFMDDISKRVDWADLVVGHNVDFDLSVMIREFQMEHKYSKIVDLPKFDTMKEGKQIVKAKDIKGKIKDPRLEEAMEFYGISQTGSFHNALVDTLGTAEVFKKMFLEK